MKILPLNNTKQRGFTIVELMIATLVFAVILLVITYGVISFTNNYYRGINTSTTQVAAQNAMDSIAQAIQFTSTPSVATDGSQGFFCAGTKLYVYSLGKQYAGTPTATDRGLYEMNRPGGGCAYQAPANGVQLLGEGMRILSINVASVSSPAGSAPVWSISLKIANGDSELLCNQSVAGSCGNGAGTFAPGVIVSGNTIGCKPDKGSHFCSIASISTVAQQRIMN